MTFKYYISETKYFVTPKNEIWKKSIPLNRGFVNSEIQKHAERKNQDLPVSITYGDYFCAIRSFLEKNRFEIIRKSVELNQIDEVLIFLEKHGEFYHPCRVLIHTCKKSFCFLVNVAVSGIGKEYIKQEYLNLKRLHNEFEICFIPHVYGIDFGTTPNGLNLPMFLGEWFDGFCEFHICIDPIDKNKKLIVWDSQKGNFFLNSEQCFEVYKQAAMILTWYYNIETFEQVFSWHHAAGDFIIKLIDNNRIKMKLVTVRKYAPMIENSDNDPEKMIEGLVLFLLNMSVKNRLDRINGTQDLIWADNIAVKASLTGFFHGLDLKVKSKIIPDNFIELFKNYLQSYSQTELYDTAMEVMDHTFSDKLEQTVIKHNLKEHIAGLHFAIKEY